jgi:serine/threonine protein kinase
MVTIGERVGSYRVVRAIGSGGMGMVMEAVHERIRSRAAIKILHTQYSQNPELRERFLTEALATNLVQHPGIVSVFEHGQTDGGDAYIIMEYLEGQSLRGRIDAALQAKRDARPPASGGAPVGGTPRSGQGGPGLAPGMVGEGGQDRAALLRLLRQLASTLSAAHDKGIIHRDLKPDNVMIIKDPFTMGGERVKVLDFGIAKVLGPEGARVRTGGLLGTPAYMAPEAWAGAATVDAKADVYALGMMFFEALTGELPLEDARDNIGRWQEVHQTAAPRPLSSLDPSVPAALDTLVARMLAKQPRSRPDMAEVAAELDQLVGQNLRFRAGGFVRDGEFYVRRDADDTLFYALLNGHSAYVFAPRQSGKTSLLHAISHRLTHVRGPALERGLLCANLDLRSVEASGGSSERFFFELVRELYRALSLPGVATDFWTDVAGDPKGSQTTPVERFTRLLRVLPRYVGQPVVIFIDHIEVLLRLPDRRGEFLAALARVMPAPAAQPSDKPQPLSFCLLGTALKEDLLPDGLDGPGSPFAGGRCRTIALPDLSPTQARAFLPGLHRLGGTSEQALNAVLRWTAGHPYLTQRLCEALTTRALPDGLLGPFVDSLAGEVIAGQREEACFAYAAEELRKAGALTPTMLSLYRRVLPFTEGLASGSFRATETAPGGKAGPEERTQLLAIARLELLGLLRKTQDVGGETRLAPRNQMFAAVFSEAWLREQEAHSPLRVAVEKWQQNQRHPEYLLSGKQLGEALSWARDRGELSSDEQAFLGAAVEREGRLQRRRVAFLSVVAVLLSASLLGSGLAFRSMRRAKQEVEAQQVRTALALREAESARKEADNAREKMQNALNRAAEALQLASEAQVTSEGAQTEAARQRGAAAAANLRAKQASDRAMQAAREATTATQSAHLASRRADEALQSAGRSLSEKDEALAGAEARLQTCQREHRAAEAAVANCQKSLETLTSDAQGLRGQIATQTSQLAAANSQLATSLSQLSACQAAASRASEARERQSATPSPEPPAPAKDPAPAAAPAEKGREPSADSPRGAAKEGAREPSKEPPPAAPATN